MGSNQKNGQHLPNKAVLVKWPFRRCLDGDFSHSRLRVHFRARIRQQRPMFRDALFFAMGSLAALAAMAILAIHLENKVERLREEIARRQQEPF